MNNDFKISVLYVGQDPVFYDGLRKDMKKILNKNSKLVKFEQKAIGKDHYPKFFKKVWKKKPTAIILDFSSYVEGVDLNYERLSGIARLLRQNKETRPILTIAVHDFLQTKGVVEDLLLSGIRFNYIKSSENDLMANEILSVLSIIGLEAQNYAVAKTEQNTILF